MSDATRRAARGPRGDHGALLQDSDLHVFDESFAALDPDTLRQTMRAVFDRCPTLLVVAHP